MTLLDAAHWDQFLVDHPAAHILQSAAWGDLKAGFGWFPVRLQVKKTGAQILFRKLPFGLTIAYIPKGPVGEDWRPLWAEVETICKQNRAVFLKVEPDKWEGQRLDIEDLPAGSVLAEPIQPRRTVEISLAGREDDWLAGMKQKTRYNVRLAHKKEVVIRESNQVEVFHQLMQTTGQRDQFGVHSEVYYQRAYDLFSRDGKCALLLAEYNGLPLAGIMVFAQGKRAWYFYGASGNAERSRMPAYALQFAAMRWAAAKGCQVYDLWGIPDADEAALEAEFAGRDDGLWGVYRFKRGFGGEIRRSVGAWDKVYQPAAYKLYQYFKRWRRGE